MLKKSKNLLSIDSLSVIYFIRGNQKKDYKEYCVNVRKTSEKKCRKQEPFAYLVEVQTGFSPKMVEENGEVRYLVSPEFKILVHDSVKINTVQNIIKRKKSEGIITDEDIYIIKKYTKEESRNILK